MIDLGEKNKLPVTIYSDYLEDINGVRFTPREVDVIACVLNGRSAKTIPSLLCISAKTVATHLANIRAKAGCSSRESIINFIERSGKLTLIKQSYYASLLVQSYFENQIKGISKQQSQIFILHGSDASFKLFADRLKCHLELAGFSTRISVEPDHEGVAIYQSLAGDKVKLAIDVSPINYYTWFFSILNQLMPLHETDKLINDFRSYCDGLHGQMHSSTPPDNLFVYKGFKSRVLMGITSLCFFLMIAAWMWTNSSSQNASIRSDLILPSEITLVNRSALIEKISQAFRQQKGIASVAIVGIGGAGKTTLAHNYGKQLQDKTVWEVNAETQESLQRSFEDLAFALVENDEDKSLWWEIQDVKDFQKRQERMISFVRARLKTHPNWFLIFDNVEIYKDIEKYFPHDSALWGEGRVLLTTRNSTILNNSPIGSMVQIGELSKEQKIELFSQIMKQDSSAQLNEDEARKLLVEIPPFPLDVSLAAYYIKSTNISYETYIEHIKADESAFSGLQEEMLKESGGYDKTRYKIVALAVNKLISENKEYRDLLVMLSLVDSQNIPKELLDRYKGDRLAESFIYSLKKYSLISEGTLSTPAEPTLSIHRSTQKIVLDQLRLEINQEEIHCLCGAVDSLATAASDKENFTKLKCLISHFKRMLECDDLIMGENWVVIAKELGWIYFYLGYYEDAIKVMEQCKDILSKDRKHDNSLLLAHVQKILGATYLETKEYVKAEKLLNHSLMIFKNIKGENHELVAFTLQHLGTRAYHRGEYIQAKELYQKAKTIFTINYSHEHIAVARINSRLGDVDRELGDYVSAKNVLEESLALYTKCVEKDNYRIGQAQARLGRVYKEIGECNKAKELLEQGLVIFKKYYPKNCDKVLRLAADLGQVEYELGNLEEALKILGECHDIYQSLYPGDFRLGWIKLYLGQVYMAKGDFERAKILLEQSLTWHENNYGKDHKQTARVIRSMGELHFLQGDMLAAERRLRKSLTIDQSSDHPQTFLDLELLGELYWKRSEISENASQADEMRREALCHFQQAIKILQSKFPSDSPHLKRLQQRIRQLDR